MSKNRNELMALLSVWSITLVVLGHSGFEETEIALKLKGLHDWIYSFHMLLFFFISGYLFSLTNPDFKSISTSKFIKKKVLRLIVPYLFLGVVLFFIKYAFSELSHSSREFLLKSFFYMSIAPGSPDSTMGYLTYVVTLFFMFVIAVSISMGGIDLKNNKTTFVVIVISFVLGYLFPGISIFNLSALLWYFPFFIIGIIVNRNEWIFSSHSLNKNDNRIY